MKRGGMHWRIEERGRTKMRNENEIRIKAVKSLLEKGVFGKLLARICKPGLGCGKIRSEDFSRGNLNSNLAE